jgi:hypothetical protein
MKHFSDDREDEYDSMEEYEEGIGKHFARKYRDEC